MKLTGYIEKWAGGILGAVSVILLLNLVLQFSGVRAGSRRPLPSPPPAAEKGKAGAADSLAQFDPVVRLDDLKRIDGRPLPELSRNPFEFVSPPAPPKAPPGPGPAPAPPPAPPPMTLKPMGYSENVGGQKEAYISEEDQVYVVHEGDTVANKYKILKITTKAVTVEDVATHQTAELPIPQE